MFKVNGLVEKNNLLGCWVVGKEWKKYIYIFMVTCDPCDQGFSFSSTL